VTEAKQSAEHQAVLLAELQHRVRNIMAMIRAITARTGETAGSIEDYADLIRGRLMALARTQTLLTRAANAGVEFATIVNDELGAQAQHPGQYELSGPRITLSPKAAEVMALAVHELATNALKYGALSIANGHVHATWRLVRRGETPWLSFDWSERGTPVRAGRQMQMARRGFGTELIEERIPYELRGHGQLSIGPKGAQCHLEFPLTSGASILGTDAPVRSMVFGGAIDMAGEPLLTGFRILIAEDDFYLASDTARALRSVGAEIAGPFPTEAAALAELENQKPSAAVVDINLGTGASFALARTLQDQSVPFIFVTGYDEAVIPVEFNEIKRLQKPLELRQIVRSLAQLLNP
jgi:two-component sensor histidine kinase/CheY-like chemotaxis protein